jgi:site-specific recombinase XerD
MKSITLITNQNEQALVLLETPGTGLAIHQNPATGYLAALRTEGGRRVQKQALASVARLLRRNLATATHDEAVLAIEWHALNNAHVKAIATKLAAQHSPKTANRKLDAVRGVLRQAWLNGLMSRDEYERAINVERVPGSRLLRGRDVSSGEIRALFASCASDGGKLAARDAALLAILYGAGLRRAEAAALVYGDWNRETNELRVIGKGNKERLASLPSGAVRAIEAWLLERGPLVASAPLLCGITKGGKATGQPLTTQAIWKALQARALRAGVEKLSPHDLRRSLAGDLYDAGADGSTIQKQLGHANINTTALYDRRGQEARRKALDLVNVPFAN